MTVVSVSFVAFLCLFLGVGIYSARFAQSSKQDYLLAGRSVPPWLTALSAVATNNSGFMFIALIGMTYSQGISAIWIMVGWILGDLLAWVFVYKRLRETSEELYVHSVPELLAQIGKKVSRPVSIIAGFIILIFLGSYAAAQIKAGSKALYVLLGFGWENTPAFLAAITPEHFGTYFIGSTIGIIIVVVYCFSGGIRASIWTDAAQSFVMIFSMALLWIIGLMRADGPMGLWDQLGTIDPALVTLQPEGLKFGLIAFLFSWVAAGLGVVGQPHVVVRAMSISSPDGIRKARTIYFIWYIMFTIAAIGVGLICRVLIPEMAAQANPDFELALPKLTMRLLPEVLVGLTLAGLFAATMSTADSQVLSCSAAITNDIVPTWGKSYLRTKLGTLLVALLVYLLALFGPASVFELVVDSWAALAASLGPLLVIQVFKLRLNLSTAIATMLSGLGMVMIWWWVVPEDVSQSLYAVMPGMLTGFAVYAVLSRFIPDPAPTGQV